MLRRPLPDDADGVFLGWASDSVATQFMSWPRHQTVEDSRAFLDFSDAQWEAWPAGPYMIESRSSGELLGSCGFAFHDHGSAEVGYILSRSAWGFGYATESLAAQVAVAATLGSIMLGASVHPDNHASLRVLEKCDFDCDRSSLVAECFPNLQEGSQAVAIRCVRALNVAAAAQQRY